MSVNDWQRKINRADELARQHPAAAELLSFYGAIVRFQERFYREMGTARTRAEGAENPNPFAQALEPQLVRTFKAFLSVVEENGPGKLKEAAQELGARGEDAQFQLLAAFWDMDGSGVAAGADDFLARAFLQPYAVAVRVGANLQWRGPTVFICPFCKRKPGLGVLRPVGEGGQRSLICSLCLAEWEFRRLICASCGEEDPAKLALYTAEEWQHVRVEACDSCKGYIKTVDLTKSGLGEPVVDEMASAPLDLWAQERGYAKLQVNLLQL